MNGTPQLNTNFQPVENVALLSIGTALQVHHFSWSVSLPSQRLQREIPLWDASLGTLSQDDEFNFYSSRLRFGPQEFSSWEI